MSGVSPINAGNVEPKTPVKTPVKSATPIKQQSFAAAEKEEGMSTAAKMIGGAVLVGIGATAAYFLTKGKNKAALEEATKKADEAKKALDELKAKMPDGANKSTQQVTEAGNKSTQQATDVGNKATDKVVDKANAEVQEPNNKLLPESKEQVISEVVTDSQRHITIENPNGIKVYNIVDKDSGDLLTKTVTYPAPNAKGFTTEKFGPDGKTLLEGTGKIGDKEVKIVVKDGNTEIHMPGANDKKNIVTGLTQDSNNPGQYVKKYGSGDSQTEEVFDLISGKHKKTVVKQIANNAIETEEYLDGKKIKEITDFGSGTKVVRTFAEDGQTLMQSTKFDRASKTTEIWLKDSQGPIIQSLTNDGKVFVKHGNSKYIISDFINRKPAHQDIVQGVIKSPDGKVKYAVYTDKNGVKHEIFSEDGMNFMCNKDGKTQKVDELIARSHIAISTVK